MPDGAGEIVYSVDTNAFMDWQARYYPTDVFPSLLVRISDLVAQGRAKAPALVHEEIDAVGTCELGLDLGAKLGIVLAVGQQCRFGQRGRRANRRQRRRKARARRMTDAEETSWTLRQQVPLLMGERHK